MDPKQIDVLESTIKAVNVKRREVLHVISTGAPDRAGDIVEPSGVNLENYRRNPVVLLNHDYRAEKIIGRGEIYPSDTVLEARTTFAKTPLASDMFELVKEGFAKAWSVGFKPLVYEAIADEKGLPKGFRYTEWDLLEYSLVPIPMNPDAVTAAVKVCRDPDVIKLLNTQAPRPAESPPASPETTARSPETNAAFDHASRLLGRHSIAQSVFRILRGGK